MLNDHVIRVINEAPAQLSHTERLLLFSLVVSQRPSFMLEVGAGNGGSAQIISCAMDVVNHGHLISIDPNPELTIDWETISHRATLLLGHSPHMLSKACEAAAGDFDFCFIDGDHRYEGVVKDIFGCLRCLKTGCYILCHDAHFREVAAAIDDCVLLTNGLIECGILNTEKNNVIDGEHWGGMKLLRITKKYTQEEIDYIMTKIGGLQRDSM